MVTGCAGFIGSTLCDKLLQDNHEVVGVDSFTANYGRSIKERNLTGLLTHPKFHFIEQDLLQLDLPALLQGINVVYHQAALPGVRSSWGNHFAQYVNQNILATQLLLEAVKVSSVEKVIYASSSSVYGGMTGPTPEDSSLHPISPYGVTKLSAEQLCQLYARNFGLPIISLRYFTVFGPRQRPDMAMHKFIVSMLQGTTIEVYGDGDQTRDFTFVDDVVTANLIAANSKDIGQVFNIGGGCRTSINQLIQIIERLTGLNAEVKYLAPQPGDPQHTWSNIDKARSLLGYDPKFDLERGIYLQIQDMKSLFQI